LSPSSSFLYSSKTLSSIILLVELFNGWAVSLKVPSFLFLLGIATKRPPFPSMIFRSRTMKQSSKMIVAYPFSRSSETGNTRTSVIFIGITPQPLLSEGSPAQFGSKALYKKVIILEIDFFRILAIFGTFTGNLTRLVPADRDLLNGRRPSEAVCYSSRPRSSLRDASAFFYSEEQKGYQIDLFFRVFHGMRPRPLCQQEIRGSRLACLSISIRNRSAFSSRGIPPATDRPFTDNNGLPPFQGRPANSARKRETGFQSRFSPLG